MDIKELNHIKEKIESKESKNVVKMIISEYLDNAIDVMEDNFRNGNSLDNFYDSIELPFEKMSEEEEFFVDEQVSKLMLEILYKFNNFVKEMLKNL